MPTIIYEVVSGKMLAIIKQGFSNSVSVNYKTETSELTVDQDGLNLQNFYVKGGKVEERPDVIFSLSGSILDFSTLPSPTKITITNASEDFATFTEQDGKVTLEDSGDYKLKILPPFPYKPLIKTVSV